jgi:DNA-directed RNA polymerase specialized sigma24 family protein
MAAHASDPEATFSRAAGSFATTHWSVVVAAGQCRSPDSQGALATLCEAYWYPLYVYIRRRGYGAEDARDLTQAFFAQLLEKQTLQVADRQRGKFRSFLLASLNHFLANEGRRTQAKKRGGGQKPFSLDLQSGENRYRNEPFHQWTAEKIFERRWALTVLEQALCALRNESVAAGKLPLFEQLKFFLGGSGGSLPYSELAVRLGTTEGAIKVAMHRLRRRYGELLRAEIAQTVAEPDQIDEELRHLFTALSS